MPGLSRYSLLPLLLLVGCEIPSQDCPVNATWGEQTCSCDAGTFGEISWVADDELYSGECVTAVEMAVRTGDASYVSDAAPILNEARLALDAAAGTWGGILRDIYGDGPITYVPTIWSQHVRANSLEENTTLVLGSADGQSLAAIGRSGETRYAAFGVELLSSFANGANSDFEDAFARTVSWTLNGEAGSLPAGASVAVIGMGGGQDNALAWVDGRGWDGEACSMEEVSGCLSGRDLLIVGAAGGDANVSAFLPAFEDAVDVGTAVLFLHTETWGASAFGAAALGALDLSYGDYGGNYWSDDLADWGSVDDMLADGGAIAALGELVDHLLAGDYDFDWSQCTEYVGQWNCAEVPGFREGFLDGANTVRAALGGLDRRALRLFDEEGRRIWKLMALLGDVYRRSIAYPMDKETTPVMEFMEAYFSDHSVVYGRDLQDLQEDMGSFSDGAEQGEEPAATEVTDVSVSRHGGFTAIGAYALPGQVVTIERTDGEELSAWVAVNTQRTGSTREFGGNSYDRPKFLQSPTIPLVPGVPVSFVSPYGGTLQLHVSGSQADRTLSVRVEGAGRHEVYALGEDAAAYAEALQGSPFPFTEIRNPYVQVHSLSSMMLDSIAAYEGDLDLFFSDLEQYMIQDTYNLAGFVGEGLEQSGTVLAFCGELGWDCTDPAVHGKPALQHINVDAYAQCGAGCSGNPYDQAWPLGPLGWGETHEIGHNLQRSRIRIYGGRSSEVSNQLFPLHKHQSWAADTGESLSPDRSNYRYVFDTLQAATQTSDPTQAIYEAIWEADGTYDNNGDRMNFYLQLVHRSEDVTWLDSGWDIYTMMYLQDRIMQKALADEDSWDAAKEDLGFSTYADRPDMDGNDFMLLASSWLTERDQRSFFDMFGVTWSSEADAQLDSYGIPEEPRTFWANEDTNTPPTADSVLIDGSSTWPL